MFVSRYRREKTLVLYVSSSCVFYRGNRKNSILKINKCVNSEHYISVFVLFKGKQSTF